MTKINFKNKETKHRLMSAVLIAAVMLSMTGLQNTFAQSAQNTETMDDKGKGNYDVWQKHKASISPLTTISTGATCTHTATWLNPCFGNNVNPLADQFFYFIPYSVQPVHHGNCPYPYADCLDTDMQVQGNTPITWGGISWTFKQALAVICTTDSFHECSNTTTFYNNNQKLFINNFPSNVPAQEQLDYTYTAPGQADLHVLVTWYLQYGIN